MNTSIATLSIQCGDENSLYLEGNRVKPQCFSFHALNGENYCSAIHRRQHYFVVGASVRTRGARMFTPQMIAGSTQKEGTYHFFEMKGTALSLMVPNMGSKWKRKKDAVNTFKV
jgi:hypothetical protein